MSRPGKKRIAVDISEEFHKDMKRFAKKRNISLTTWLLRVIYIGIKEELKWE